MTKFDQVTNYLQHKQLTWLITGIAGFIGSNLFEVLLKLNQKVFGVDNFATGNKRNIEEVLQSCELHKKANFQFNEVDICDLSAMKKVM